VGGVDWIDLAKGRNSWRDVVKTVTDLRVEQSAGNFLTSWATVSFSRRTSRPGVSRLIPSCPSLQSCQLAAMNCTGRLAEELAALADGDPLFGRQKEHDAWIYFTLHGVDWSSDVSARADAIRTCFLSIFWQTFHETHRLGCGCYTYHIICVWCDTYSKQWSFL